MSRGNSGVHLIEEFIPTGFSIFQLNFIIEKIDQERTCRYYSWFSTTKINNTPLVRFAEGDH